MSKSKSSSKSAKGGKTDVLAKVKDAAVTKPAQTIKAKAKDLAKQVVAKEEKKDKKSKKVKEPTPEPSEPSEDEDSESAESDSSASENEVETKKSALNGKSKGNTKSQPKEASSDESESEADSDSEPEVEAPKANGSAKKSEALLSKAKASVSESESESESDSDESVDAPNPAIGAESSEDDAASDSSDDSSDDEKPTKKSAAKPAETLKAADGKSGSGLSDESDEDSDESDESDKEEVSAKPVKRKAEEEVSKVTKKSKPDTAETPTGTNLFIGNLSWNVDEAWLKEVFEEFGELAGVRIVTERDTGRSKGFGYVEFVNPEDAAKAHSAKAGADLDGRAMNVDFANARPDNAQKQDNRRKSYGDQLGEPSDTLFLGNLSFEVGQEAVTEAFAAHGTILGIRLPTDRETGQPKGFGYVTFASIDEAKLALEAMQGAYIEGRPLRIDYSSPRPQNSDSPARGRGGFGGRGGGGRGGRGGRGGNFNRGGFGGRGGGRGGRGGSTNRGGFGDFSGKKTSFA